MPDKSKLIPNASERVPPLSHAQRSAPTAPLFPLGQTVATPGALRLLAKFNVSPVDLLQRHISGDWGDDLRSSDRFTNNVSLVNGERLLSSYTVGEKGNAGSADQRVWVLTEWDRSVTTLLLPDEY
ncbi:MAG: hypothetical protein Q7U63_14465 [Polaromonas sp.]|uniref:hypothetical protein n=1 Tax=Polaromonas sp. TaxID=1869339 RepID=UPI00271577EC|nr:hypothetical protein [Polaromonas sp.]MDO9114980.1 hypothetical protein [Polaromonas sp.]MDP1885568.1 hypothetical protein [Polaromonas sp.]